MLQIGGLKEKLLAAHRAGIKRVLIPERNVKDLVDVPEQARNEIEIIPIKTMDEVLPLALTELPEALADLAARAPSPVVIDATGKVPATPAQRPS